MQLIELHGTSQRHYLTSVAKLRHLCLLLLYCANKYNAQLDLMGWSGGAMVLGKLPVPGRPTCLVRVEQGSTALAVGAGGGCSDIFTLIYPLSSLSPSLWETTRYRLKYCLKGSLRVGRKILRNRLN